MNKMLTAKQDVGIQAIGICIPRLGLKLEELAKLRNVDLNKYTIGLGCHKMALGTAEQSVIEIATLAAERCLEHWQGDKKFINFLAVGTETPVDKSRPLSAWIAEHLGLEGFIRSYEVKHACYGGTLALMQAVEYFLARGCPEDEYALVVAADICLYEPSSPGEPTQGAAAVAFIIGKPLIARINYNTVAYSKAVFDFWKPMDEIYPRIDGKYSVESYCNACKECFSKFSSIKKMTLKEYSALCFHTPFPAMTKKALFNLVDVFNFTNSEAEQLYELKVKEFQEWNCVTGNSYTASLWINVCNALAKLQKNDKLFAFSYGSGCGAELIELEVLNNESKLWVNDITDDLKNTHYITKEEYTLLRTK